MHIDHTANVTEETPLCDLAGDGPPHPGSFFT